MRPLCIFALSLTGALLTPLSAGAQGLPEPEAPSWHRMRVTLSQYCTECHGGFLTEGGLDLVSQREESSIAENPEQWEQVISALRNHYMPSEDGRPMPRERRDELIDGIHDRLASLTAAGHPSSAELRRLNRVQFNNTLKDLFFIERDFLQNLPPDDSGYGFDTTADVLTVTPLLLEKYLDVASEAGYLACPSRVPSATTYISAAELSEGYTNINNSLNVVFSGGMERAAKGTLSLPGPGRYRLEVSLSGQQAGDELVRAGVFLNGEKLDSFTVESDTATSPDTFSVHFDYSGTPEPLKKPEEGELYRFSGPLEVAITLENDFYQTREEGRPLDRNLVVVGLTLVGPDQSGASLDTEFIRYHFGAEPSTLTETKLREGIWRFASRAFRRPATKDEVNTLWRVYKETLQKYPDDPRAALRAVVDAVVASPNFIFRNEPANPDNGFALASWLAYFLWSAPPDDRLYELARKGELTTNLDAEIDRMLKSPKADALTDSFAAQWLSFGDLAFARPAKKAYPDFNRRLVSAMQAESVAFMKDLIQNDRSILRILDADYTFADPQLAKFYGVELKGRGQQRISLEDTPRRGIWSQGSTLMVTSHATRTSPVLRGKWILQNLLGLSPPPPPNNVPSLIVPEDKNGPQTLLESMAAHRDNPDCRGCHVIMDPIGLALEAYDGTGAWRSTEDLSEIGEVTLFDGQVIGSPTELAQYLVQERREDFVLNMARQLSIYATGRGLTWRDQAALDQIVRETETGDYRFSALVKAIVRQYGPHSQRLFTGQEMAQR